MLQNGKQESRKSLFCWAYIKQMMLTFIQLRELDAAYLNSQWSELMGLKPLYINLNMLPEGVYTCTGNLMASSTIYRYNNILVVDIENNYKQRWAVVILGLSHTANPAQLLIIEFT